MQNHQHSFPLLGLIKEMVSAEIGLEEEASKCLDVVCVYLHEHASAQSGLDEALGHPAGCVGGAAVHFGVVLPREGAASVRSPAPVRVHDDLTARQPGVTLTQTHTQTRVRGQTTITLTPPGCPYSEQLR